MANRTTKKTQLDNGTATETLTLRTSPDALRDMRAMAVEDNVSLNNLVNTAVLSYLSKAHVRNDRSCLISAINGQLHRANRFQLKRLYEMLGEFGL